MQPQTFTYTLIKSASVRPAAPPGPVTAPTRVRNSAWEQDKLLQPPALFAATHGTQTTCNPGLLGHVFAYIRTSREEGCFNSNKIILKTHLSFVCKVLHQARAWLLWGEKKKKKQKKKKDSEFSDNCLPPGQPVTNLALPYLGDITSVEQSHRPFGRRHENSRLKTPGRNS